MKKLSTSATSATIAPADAAAESCLHRVMDFGDNPLAEFMSLQPDSSLGTPDLEHWEKFVAAMRELHEGFERTQVKL